jgi:D-serine deaminase-like pyridoxal phosphate-dependent protein
VTRLDASGFALRDDDVEQLLSPALLVDLAAVRRNVRAILALCGGDASRWRPHLKTTKIAPVWRELVLAGVRAFKCATTREAALLLDLLRNEGVRGGDLLVAHPLVGPARARLAALAREHGETRLSLLAEESEDVEATPRELSLFVDVNPGMDRTGVDARDPKVVERLVAIARRAGERFRGLHFYDGHIHDVEYAPRKAAAHAAYDRLMELVAALARAGVAVPEIVTSGTPTLKPALEYAPFRPASPGRARDGAPLHRVSPGTVVFHDLRSAQECPELELAPAAVVLARVVSHPAPALITCDAGSKSLAAEAGDPVACALGRPELVARRPSEEHLPFDVTSGERPARGTRLHLFPRHVCPTVNLAEECVLIDSGRIVDVAPVAARAHELRKDMTRS